jgi:hypothetical protein
VDLTCVGFALRRLSIKRDRMHVLFGGTKLLQSSGDKAAHIKTPDGGCLAVVLRTGFGTAQGEPRDRRRINTALTPPGPCGCQKQAGCLHHEYISCLHLAWGALCAGGVVDASCQLTLSPLQVHTQLASHQGNHCPSPPPPARKQAA